MRRCDCQTASQQYSFESIIYLTGISDEQICGNNNIFDGNFVAGAQNDPEHNPVGFWPWIASLGSFNDLNEWVHQCGATLITQKHFLTAAHCTKNSK